jgi:hypothetical protein
MTCGADELGVKGRDILEKNRQAVVSVQVVLNMTYGGSTPRETKQELTGTVVDGSGLTVLSLSSCDPSEMFQRISPDDRSRMQAEVTDIKILLEDTTELPAEIVLRDKDLDLAFIRPKSKLANPMPAIDLGESSPAMALDQVLALHRLNSAAGRACAAAAERVSAVIKKPRLFYIPENTLTATTPGAPAFSLDGKIVGVFLLRAISAKGGSSSNLRNNMTAIILPAEDILKAARQAPAVGTATEKKATAEEK